MSRRVHTLMKNTQDENVYVGETVVNGMADMFITAQTWAKKRIITAYKRGIGEKLKTIVKAIMVGIGLRCAEILKSIAVDVYDIRLRLGCQAEAHNLISFLAFSLI